MSNGEFEIAQCQRRILELENQIEAYKHDIDILRTQMGLDFQTISKLKMHIKELQDSIMELGKGS
jgi:chromosome segregation ATPase